MSTLLYNLELTRDEIFDLWLRLAFLENSGRLLPEEQSILEKLDKLMEGQ